MRSLLTFLILLLATGGAAAQDAAKKDTINTDRPDQSESPHVVPKGAFQIEAGAMLTRFDSSAVKSGIGTLAIRYGIGKRFEIGALIQDGRNRDVFMEEATQGIYPLALSGKVILQDKEGLILPEAALVAYLKLPFTSRSGEQKPYWSPTITLALENKIGKKTELEYNVGAKQDPYDKDWEWLASTSLHYELSWRLKVFGEYFGDYQKGEEPVHNFDCGVMYLFTPSLQADVTFGLAFSAPAEKNNSFAGLGISWLLPH